MAFGQKLKILREEKTCNLHTSTFWWKKEISLNSFLATEQETIPLTAAASNLVSWGKESSYYICVDTDGCTTTLACSWFGKVDCQFHDTIV